MKKHCYRIYLVCPLPHIFSLSNHCFQFLPGITVVPTETENNTWAKLWKCKKFTLEFAESNWQDCSSSFTTVFKIDRKLKKDLTEQGLRIRPVLTTALRNSMNDLHFGGVLNLASLHHSLVWKEGWWVLLTLKCFGKGLYLPFNFFTLAWDRFYDIDIDQVLTRVLQIINVGLALWSILDKESWKVKIANRRVLSLPDRLDLYSGIWASDKKKSVKF